MATFTSVAMKIIILLVLILVSAQASLGTRKLTALYQESPSDEQHLKYHNGAVLHGNIHISVMWYGAFSPAQKSIITDFLHSLCPSAGLRANISTPSVPQWWRRVDQLYLARTRKSSSKKANVLVASQVSDPNCTMGKSLKMSQIAKLADEAGPKKGGIALVFTSADVSVEGFCESRCGVHGTQKKTRSVYIWVGNSATHCPGLCAWPFHQAIYGPQTPALVPPNGDAGADGMVISLATLMADAVTNPNGKGFFKGQKDAQLEAATACPGVYAKGAYPGYAGHLLVDLKSGASYNAKGVHGRKFVVPALFDPFTSTCSTLV